MKYKFKTKKQPIYGEERIIKKYLFFPLIIDNELRWLCSVKILQRHLWKIDGFGLLAWFWKDIKFIDI